MKWIPQSESAECGLACLAMIASHHGHAVGLRQLRERFPLSLKGASVTRLVEVAGELGLHSRPLRAELEYLPRLQLPCILHWDLNHFVVLVKADRQKVEIMDPATGARKLTYEEVSERFTGVALELTPAKTFTRVQPPPSISLRQLTGSVTGLWNALGLLLLLSLVLQVFAVLAPFYLQWIIDQVLVTADHELLTLLGLGFGMLVLLQGVTHALRGWTVAFLSSRLGLQWMGNVFGHMLRLPMDFFGKRHLGDIVSRMGAVDAIQRTLTTSFVEAIIDGLMGAVTLLMMLIYSWKLTVVTLVAVAIYLGIRVVLFQPMRTNTEQHLMASAKQSSYLFESIRGMQSIKIAGRESMRQAGYLNLMNETTNRQLRLAKFGIGFTTANQLVFGFERVAVIWIGAYLAMSNVFSVGMLMAYLAYKDQFAQRVGGLIDKWVELRMLRMHGERLADIALTPPEGIDAAPGTATPTPVSMRIAIKNLSFRYAEGEPWILRDCSFTVEEGESVAIIGPSGCGKTTLVKLLLGLLPATEGSIEVGGVDIRLLGVRNYRALIGAVMQDDQLFAGSIAENIAFEEENVDMERVQAAAKLAAVHEEIRSMPMGYQSLTGDMGTTLSGGQKQRVVLARALYHSPRILFLDEATSHLDVDRERMVNEAVARLRHTKIIIAHRPQTIASADRVLLMENGAVVQPVSAKLGSQGERPMRVHLTAAPEAYVEGGMDA